MQHYYQDAAVTIYHGDCRDVLPTLADDSVDITVTSPPYNMGATPGGNGRGMYHHSTQKARRFGEGYDGDSDALPGPEYDEFLRSTLLDMWRVTRLAVWWNHRPRTIHGQLTDPLDGRFPVPVRQRIILARPTGIDVSLRQFVTRQEHLYLMAKPDFRLVSHAVSGIGDVWQVPIALSDHPAPFHILVPARCIASTAECRTVLDPFMGSGTTLRAAKDAGVRAVDIEKSERFCEMAADRMAQEVLDFGREETPSMMRDRLGDLFKGIEAEWKPMIPAKSFMVIRVDGRAFHTWTRGLVKPFDEAFSVCMNQAARALGEEVQGALCVFVQSDEINVIAQDLRSLASEHWFGGVVQKVASNAASIATARFNRQAACYWDEKRPATFDARVFPLPTLWNVTDYLIWRQKDAQRNAVSMLCHHHLGKSIVRGVSTPGRVKMLAAAGIDVDDPAYTHHRHGRVWAPVTRSLPVVYTRKDTGEECHSVADRTVWESTVQPSLGAWVVDRFGEEFEAAIT